MIHFKLIKNILIAGFFWLLSKDGYAEKAVIIDRFFTVSGMSAYLKLIEPRDKILEKNVNGQNRSEILSKNFDKQVFFELTIENVESQTKSLILFSDSPLTYLKVRTTNPSNQGSYEALGGKTHEDSQTPKSIIPAVLLSIPPGRSTYDIESFKGKNIGPFKIILDGDREFRLFEKDRIINNSLIVGAVISLFLYNIFLLAVNKSALIVYFSLCCLSVGLFESILSGAHSVFPVFIYDLLGQLWPLYCTLGTSGFALFLADISSTDSDKRFQKWTQFLTIFGNSFALLVIFMQEFIPDFYRFSAIFLIVLVQGWTPIFSGKFKIKEYIVIFASHLFAASTIIYLTQPTFFLISDLGSLKTQQSTTVFLLLTLSIYAGNRTHQDRITRIKLQEMISLGRNVQDLLLPKRLDEDFKTLSYSFAYEPFEGKMSGDWIKHWQTTDGSHHFLLGDVTGKGPQAALAVSIICTIVDRCMRQDLNAKAALIQINKTLHMMLNGNIGSTASGASVDPNASLVLYNTGGVGWMVQNTDTIKHILGRGSILGQKIYLDISEIKFNPNYWGVLYTFTDGLCNGPRALKLLASRIFNLQISGETPHGLKVAALNISKEIGDPQDDKAFLVIKLNERQVV